MKGQMNEGQEDLKTPVIKTALEDTKTSTALDPCVICLEKVSEKAVALPCDHAAFDFLCLISWLEEQPTCPLCKTKLTEVRYGFSGTNLTDFSTYQVPGKCARSKSSQISAVPSWANHPRPTQRRAMHPTLPRLGLFRPKRHPSALPNEHAVLARRKEVYAQNLYSLHVGSNRYSRHKDLSVNSFREPEQIRRARMFIRRELQVFSLLNSNSEFLLEYILAILKTVDIKSAGGQAEDLLAEFLGKEHATLFLHELRAWMRSPYGELEVWDRWVQYGKPNGVFRDEGGMESRIMGEGDRIENERDSKRDLVGRETVFGQRKRKGGDFYRPGTERRARRNGDKDRDLDQNSKEHRRAPD